MMKKKWTLLAFLPLLLGLQACPYKAPIFEEVGPNETAFVVPLEGDTKGGQAKFMSLEYLQGPTVKVATKRIEVPQREVDTGRMPWSYKYIPTAKVIKVNRAPVTREWLENPKPGTEATDDALGVETKESIGFGVGMTLTASIKEQDAALYLYNYGTVPLEQVVDKNIRGYQLALLSYDFGKLSLDDCRKNKGDIIKRATEATAKYFLERGITIDAAGNSGGLVFDPKIQDEIDATFIAEQNVAREENTRLAQLKINDKERSIADTKLYQAQRLAQAQQATVAMVELDIRKMQAQALVNFSEGLKEGKVQLPANILPANSPLLLGLGEKK